MVVIGQFPSIGHRWECRHCNLKHGSLAARKTCSCWCHSTSRATGKRVIVTGSRRWTDVETIRRALQALTGTGWTLVHGQCPYGADAIAAYVWASDLRYGPIEAHAAEWKQYGPKAGPMRNQEMVDAGADLVIAFPTGDSRGTWDCVRRAKAAGIPVVVIDESGNIPDNTQME